MKILRTAGTWMLVCWETTSHEFYQTYRTLLEDVVYHMEYTDADGDYVRIFFPAYAGDFVPPVDKQREFYLSGLRLFFA